MNVLYLHGFASSTNSSKATYLTKRFAERGIDVVTPDLNLPDFSTLTVTRMLAHVSDAIARFSTDPIVLIGSSLGGFVAVQAAARWPERLQALILLAPALDFSRGPAGLDERDWKKTGTLSVFHYGYGRTMPIHYGLYQDASQYDAMNLDVRMPILVFQGRRDTVVDPLTVEAWSCRRPNVELHLVDDDHQLTQSLDSIWARVAEFLLIGQSGN